MILELAVLVVRRICSSGSWILILIFPLRVKITDVTIGLVHFHRK